MSILTNRIAAPGSFSKKTHDSSSLKVPIGNFPGKSITRSRYCETKPRTSNGVEASTNRHSSVKSINQKKHLSHSKINRLEDELIRKVVEMKTKEAQVLKRKGLYEVTESILQEEMATSKKECKELLDSVTALRRSLSNIDSDN